MAEDSQKPGAARPQTLRPVNHPDREPSGWTGDDLGAAGRALFGDRWQAQMAAMLDLDVKFISRVLRDPPQAIIRVGHKRDVLRMLEQRRKTLDDLIARLK